MVLCYIVPTAADTVRLFQYETCWIHVRMLSEWTKRDNVYVWVTGRAWEHDVCFTHSLPSFRDLVQASAALCRSRANTHKSCDMVNLQTGHYRLLNEIESRLPAHLLACIQLCESVCVRLCVPAEYFENRNAVMIIRLVSPTHVANCPFPEKMSANQVNVRTSLLTWCSWLLYRKLMNVAKMGCVLMSVSPSSNVLIVNTQRGINSFKCILGTLNCA